MHEAQLYGNLVQMGEVVLVVLSHKRSPRVGRSLFGVVPEVPMLASGRATSLGNGRRGN